MKRTILASTISFCLAAFGLLQSGTATAAEHGHQMNGDHHAMSEGHHGHDKAAASDVKNGFATKPAVGTKAVCPVTGEAFTVSKETQFSHYKGKYYAFCCPGCKPQFDKDPEKYLKK